MGKGPRGDSRLNMSQQYIVLSQTWYLGNEQKWELQKARNFNLNAGNLNKALFQEKGMRVIPEEC